MELQKFMDQKNGLILSFGGRGRYAKTPTQNQKYLLNNMKPLLNLVVSVNKKATNHL
jgi:hypothetical protein